MDREEIRLELGDNFSDELVILWNKKDTEIFQEILIFLNDFFPGWRKKKELGYYAPELILETIELYEELDEWESKAEWLANIYEYIAYRYDSYKSFSFDRNLEIAFCISRDNDFEDQDGDEDDLEEEQNFLYF